MEVVQWWRWLCTMNDECEMWVLSFEWSWTWTCHVINYIKNAEKYSICYYNGVYWPDDQMHIHVPLRYHYMCVPRTHHDVCYDCETKRTQLSANAYQTIISAIRPNLSCLLCASVMAVVVHVATVDSRVIWIDSTPPRSDNRKMCALLQWWRWWCAARLRSLWDYWSVSWPPPLCHFWSSW